MTDFILKQLPYDLSNQAGLALVGKYLKRININDLADPTFSVRGRIAKSDVLKSYQISHATTPQQDRDQRPGASSPCTARQRGPVAARQKPGSLPSH